MNHGLIILIASLVFSAAGFVKTPWFLTAGCGGAAAATGAALLALYGKDLTAASAAACALLFLYGLRLAGYLVFRETQRSYRSRRPDVERQVTVPAKLAVWISVSVHYVSLTAPIAFRLRNGIKADAALAAGVAVMMCGLAIETVADIQKFAAKKENPYKYVSSGIFRFVRMPGLLGDIIFWAGAFISGVTSNRGALQWAIAAAGILALVYIRLCAARRLELRQNAAYGSLDEYWSYARRVPVILPFVPVRSLAGCRWLIL